MGGFEVWEVLEYSRGREFESSQRRPVSGRTGGHVLWPAPPCALFRLRLIDLLLFLIYLYHPPSIGSLLCLFIHNLPYPPIASSIYLQPCVHLQPPLSIRSLLCLFAASSIYSQPSFSVYSQPPPSIRSLPSLSIRSLLHLFAAFLLCLFAAFSVHLQPSVSIHSLLVHL